MRKEFSAETPELIIIVTEKKDAPFLEKAFQKGLDQLKDAHVALSLAIKPADMKNMMKALKLMDVKGLYLHGKKGASALLFKKNVVKRAKIIPQDTAFAVTKAIELWTGRKIDQTKLARQVKRLSV